MKRSTTPSYRVSGSNHTAIFEAVFDSRKRKVIGLWRRGDRYYGQLRVDLGNGRTAPRRIPIQAGNLDEAKGSNRCAFGRDQVRGGSSFLGRPLLLPAVSSRFARGDMSRVSHPTRMASNYHEGFQRQEAVRGVRAVSGASACVAATLRPQATPHRTARCRVRGQWMQSRDCHAS